jgi:hypothetical protein
LNHVVCGEILEARDAEADCEEVDLEVQGEFAAVQAIYTRLSALQPLLILIHILEGKHSTYQHNPPESSGPGPGNEMESPTCKRNDSRTYRDTPLSDGKGADGI